MLLAAYYAKMLETRIDRMLYAVAIKVVVSSVSKLQVMPDGSRHTRNFGRIVHHTDNYSPSLCARSLKKSHIQCNIDENVKNKCDGVYSGAWP